MKGLKHKLVFIYLVSLFGFFLPALALPETPNKEAEDTEAEQIVINSMTIEMNNKLKLVTFSGDVNAKQEDFVIDCDKMLVYYESMPAQQKKEGAKTNINKVVATGNVVINRTKGEEATAEELIYYPEDDRMVLTGSPTVKRGDDLVKGDRITIFLKEERSVVEKGSVTISPKHEQR